MSLFHGRSIVTIFIVIGLFSMFTVSASFAQDSDGITQQQFALMLFNAKQLDGQFTNADTGKAKINILEKLGYAPEGGYTPTQTLTLGDFATVMVKVLKMQSLLPESPLPKDYIKVLADDGIIKKQSPEHKVTFQEVKDAFTIAKLPVSATSFPKYARPLSPID